MQEIELELGLPRDTSRKHFALVFVNAHVIGDYEIPYLRQKNFTAQLWPIGADARPVLRDLQRASQPHAVLKFQPSNSLDKSVYYEAQSIINTYCSNGKNYPKNTASLLNW